MVGISYPFGRSDDSSGDLFDEYDELVSENIRADEINEMLTEMEESFRDGDDGAVTVESDEQRGSGGSGCSQGSGGTTRGYGSGAPF